MIPIGKGRIVQESDTDEHSQTITIITYGMGVYWAKNASKEIKSKVEIIDLRSIHPVDTELVFASVQKNGRCMVLSEEPVHNSFAQALAGRISSACFQHLDAPVKVVGSESLPAIPLNSILEKTMIPNAEKVSVAINELLTY
jgi:2-oxoisovalerate dehydrogenase E1 component